jgi:hypothetical protein
MDEPPRFAVEPVTPLALFPQGYRGGFHWSLDEARLAAERLNHPPAWSR